MKPAVLLLLPFAAFAQNGGSLVFNTPTLTPASKPSCGKSPFMFTQSVVQPWTVYNCNNIAVNSGNLSVNNATGYCSGYGSLCAIDSPKYPSSPWFSPQEPANSAGTGWAIYQNVGQTPSGGSSGSNGFGCAVGSITQSPTPSQNVPYPSCPACGDADGASPAGQCCPPGCTPAGGACACCPIVLDTTGRGFAMTDVARGVYFRWQASGPKYAMSWTDPAGKNGWLVLPDGNGQVRDATNLFSAVTPQPKSDAPNGYIALAQYDLASEGGNNNGWIDPGDKIWTRLRVWIDANQDGEAEPGELHTLDELGIKRIGLRYHLAEKTDQYGNVFRYVSQVLDESDPKAYDVWIKLSPQSTRP